MKTLLDLSSIKFTNETIDSLCAVSNGTTIKGAELQNPIFVGYEDYDDRANPNASEYSLEVSIDTSDCSDVNANTQDLQVKRYRSGTYFTSTEIVTPFGRDLLKALYTKLCRRVHDQYFDTFDDAEIVYGVCLRRKKVYVYFVRPEYLMESGV